MAFVQIIDFKTDRGEEVDAFFEGWEPPPGGTVRRVIVTQDRDDATRRLHIVFFDSYESAMENSGLPEIDALAAKMAEFVSEPPKFYNLDVIEDMTV
jgi:hypothetical protein